MTCWYTAPLAKEDSLKKVCPLWFPVRSESLVSILPRCIISITISGQELSVDAQFDESANIKDYKLVGTYGDDIKFHRPPFREQFAVGLSSLGQNW